MKRWGRAMWIVLGLGWAAFVVAWRAGEALRLALWALVAAYLANIPVVALEGKIGRMWATVVVFTVVIAVAAGLLSAVLSPALSQMGQLPLYMQRAGTTVEKLSARAPALRQVDASQAAGFLSSYGTKLLSLLAGACASAASGVTRLAAVCALAIFYIADWENLSLRLMLFVPSAWRAKAIRASHAIKRDLGAYLRGELIIILSVSALTVAALTIARAPMPLAMGTLYGALNAIPYVGPLIATVPPVAAALATGWKTALMTLVILLIIQQIDNYIISPRVMGAASGMGPAMVLLSISAGSAIAGVWGMFLALPTAVAIRAVYRTFFTAGGKDEMAERL